MHMTSNWLRVKEIRRKFNWLLVKESVDAKLTIIRVKEIVDARDVNDSVT